MKKNIFRFSIFFLCNMVLFLFSKQLYAEGEFCSDIKIPIIKDGAFDRCYIESGKCNDCSEGQECIETKLNNTEGVYLKFKFESTTTEDGPCNEDVENEISTDISENYIEEKANKVKSKKTINGKCEVTTKTPVIFNAVDIDVPDFTNGRTKTIKNAPKPAIFKVPLKKDRSCKLKSCLDLTLEEFEAIDYSKNFVSDSNGKLVFPPATNCEDNDNNQPGCKDADDIFFYKFCEPYKHYDNKSKKGDKIVIEKDKNSNIKNDPIYCHDFPKEKTNILQYLWPKGTTYDTSDNYDNYHCILHQCPIKDGLTLSCETNYLNFADRIDPDNYDYLKNYLKYISGIIEVNEKQVDNLTESELLNTLSTAKCTPLDYTKDKCAKPRVSVALDCENKESFNESCDEYVGLDKNLYKFNNGSLSDNDKEKIRNLFQLTDQENKCKGEYCDENEKNCKKYTCIKTYDCSLENNEYNKICTDLTERSQLDTELSYFYRPVPPSPATEICPSEDKTNCAGMEGRTVIRRTLRDKVDYPLKENESGSKWASNYWTYQKNNNRPKGVKNYFGTKELCASNDDDFKNFESEILNVCFLGICTKYNYGKYYDGFWQITKADQLPHILPLCKASRLGAPGSGREYMCENGGGGETVGNVCHTPSWDSYYIKGAPIYVWKDTDANIQSVTLTACLRQKNTGELSVCGERECRVDCAFGVCATQWCGIDRCVKLRTEVGKECPVVPNESQKSDKDFMKNYQNCIQQVSDSAIGGSSVRFRLQALDRKAYVFLDTTSLGCDDLNTTRRRGGKVSDGKYTYSKPQFVSYNNPKSDKNTIGGTFRNGILDEYELYDDNSLTDNNCDGIINDQDIFGEYLYKNWNCDLLIQYNQQKDNINSNLPEPKKATDEWCSNNQTPETRKANNEYNQNCKKMKITGSNSTGSLLKDKYIPIDVVQYRGNNQNIDKSDINKKIENTNDTNLRNFCKVGQLDRCRGYFDKDNNFIREQQAVILPIPVAPDFFYKHATYDNVPDLFLPILNIYRAQRANGDWYGELNSVDNKNPLLLKFFEPSIDIQYGNDREFENTKYEICTGGSNCTCLYKKTDCDCSKDYCVKPINEANSNSNIITIPFQDVSIIGKVKTKYGKNKDKDTETFYIFRKTAYLDPEPTARVCLYQILVDGKERLIRCLNRENPLISNFFIKPDVINIEKPTVKAYFHNLDSKNLISDTKITLDNSNSIIFYNNNNTSHNEGDDKLIESSYAYGQGYTIFLQKTDCSKLYYDCIFYKNEYKEKNNNSETNKEELLDLQNKINKCDIEIDSYCRNQNGNENLVLKTTKDNNNNVAAELIKVKENPNAIGGYNQMCITKGFEEDKTYQLVEAMTTQYGVLGKCILTEDSKKNANCRKRFYYEYCSQAGQDGCVCLNGESDCACSNNSCVKKIDCSCTNDNECINLPEGCYLSGFNSNNSVLNNNNELTNSCKCQIARENTNNTTRKATPRELGLCVDLIDLHFCDSVKYYDKNRNYVQGGDGKVLDIIKTDHYSNIWRTSQKQLGKTYMGDFGHAEFDKANDCSGLPDEFCNLTEICYYNSSSPLKGQSCEKGQQNCECEKVQTGICRGFWKNKNNTIPLAKCGPKMNGNKIFTDANGEAYYIFELIPGTSCERYSCPTISDENSPTRDEIIESVNATEESVSTINTEGKSNGFAAWGEYKKGTYAVSTENLEKDIENAYGDELEQREAEHCLQGYGPAGSNVAIKNYIPLSRINSNNIINTGSISDIDNIVKNMLGYNLYVDDAESTISTKAYKSNNISELNNYNIFKNYYSAREYLPVRYCSQLGNWMGVDDIYNKYKVNPYYKSNSVLHNPNLTNDGFINNAAINTYDIPTSQKNTYNNSINYSKKYCERLFCQDIKATDIGLLSIENSIPQNKLQYENLQNINYNVAYPNTTENNNYPKVANNPNDSRINTIYNNKYTYWRHTGGATWNETPAPRKYDTINITGTCYEKGGFYPHGVNFLPTFQAQYNTISFDKNEKDVKGYSFRNGIANEVNPTRTCNKWGLWSEVENKCQATCEAIDVFRTKFNDINNNNKLENFEITALYKNPKFRDDYLMNSNGVIKYGDKYTGGAKWPRSVAGTIVVGECDATVGKNNGYSGFSSNGIQFVRNGSDLKYQGAPYRECQEDGTWGPVQNPCINFTTCQDINIKNSNIYNSSNVNDNNIIVSLSGGSILPESNSYQTLFGVSTDCNTNPNYESGKITKNCDITTGEWQSGFAENSCVLKSCGDVSYKIGDISVVDYKKEINNLYYPSNSGLKGQIGNYLGYGFSQQCPDGYKCEDCDNGKLTFTCELNKSNNEASWNRVGDCVLNNCKVPSNPENGSWVDSNNNSLSPGIEVNHETKIKKVCNSNYTLTESYVGTCNNGVWSWNSDNGTCVKNCDNSKLNGNSRPANSSFSTTSGTTNYGGKQDGTCNDGYTGNVTATCGLNGIWSYSGSCSIRKCPNDGNFGISTTLLQKRGCQAGFTKYTEKKGQCKSGENVIAEDEDCPGSKINIHYNTCNQDFSRTCSNDYSWQKSND